MRKSMNVWGKRRVDRAVHVMLILLLGFYELSVYRWEKPITVWWVSSSSQRTQDVARFFELMQLWMTLFIPNHIWNFALNNNYWEKSFFNFLEIAFSSFFEIHTEHHGSEKGVLLFLYLKPFWMTRFFLATSKRFVKQHDNGKGFVVSLLIDFSYRSRQFSKFTLNTTTAERRFIVSLLIDFLNDDYFFWPRRNVSLNKTSTEKEMFRFFIYRRFGRRLFFFLRRNVSLDNRPIGTP
jgi:hypothetical protein